MKIRIILLFLAFLMVVLPAYPQKIWSLQDCIAYGRQNSLAIRSAQNQVRQAEISEQEAVHNRYPSVNGNIQGGYQFGRTIDPTTNDFDNRKIGFNSYSINVGMTLYSGNSINNTIKRNRLDLEASKLDAQFASDNLALDIAVAYLNILLAEEQLALVEKRLDQSRLQLEQTDKLIRAGSLPENDRYDILSNIALDEQSIIEARNQVNIAYLNMRQLILLEPQEEFRIQRPVIEVPTSVDPDQLSVEQVYATALDNQANIMAGDFRLESSQKGVDIAHAQFLPRLSIGGGINTTSSSAASRFNVVPTTQTQTFFINGEPVTVSFPGQDFQPIDYPYFDQLSDNLGQSVGATISIPIYNNYSARLNHERARLGVIQQEISNQNDRQVLKSNIQRAIADARAARRSLDAAQAAVDASQIAYDNARKRFDLGDINTLEFSTARNNLDQAQISLLRARYSYIFNIKQIEFYQGKGINFN